MNSENILIGSLFSLRVFQLGTCMTCHKKVGLGVDCKESLIYIISVLFVLSSLYSFNLDTFWTHYVDVNRVATNLINFYLNLFHSNDTCSCILICITIITIFQPLYFSAFFMGLSSLYEKYTVEVLYYQIKILFFFFAVINKFDWCLWKVISKSFTFWQKTNHTKVSVFFLLFSFSFSC